MGRRVVVCRALALASLVVAAAGVSAQIRPKSGAAMCVLTPADFQGAGVASASKPTANVDEGGASAYCVYAGRSAATGGVELDVFYPAGANAVESKATFDTAVAEGGSALTTISIAGTDEARWSAAAVSGGKPFATLTARKGNLVFSLGMPTSAGVQAQIVKLAALVLQRIQP